MEAKEKAIELMEKVKPHTFGWSRGVYSDECKTLAKLIVDEIIKNIDATILYHKESTALPINMKFWQEVKNEINNL